MRSALSQYKSKQHSLLRQRLEEVVNQEKERLEQDEELRRSVRLLAHIRMHRARIHQELHRLYEEWQHPGEGWWERTTRTLREGYEEGLSGMPRRRVR